MIAALRRHLRALIAEVTLSWHWRACDGCAACDGIMAAIGDSQEAPAVTTVEAPPVRYAACACPDCRQTRAVN